MTKSNNRHQNKRHFSLTAPLIGGVLVMMMVTSGVVPAYAITHLPMDEWISYGPLEWAVKNYQNEMYDDGEFGRDTDASDSGVSTECDGSFTNFIKLQVEHDGAFTDKIAWQGIMQGTDPWGNAHSEDTFPFGTPENNIYKAVDEDGSDDNLPTSGTQSVTVDTAWCWTDNFQPDASSDNVKANFLVDLWYYDSTNDQAVVIDLMVDRLYNNGGTWAQDNAFNVGDNYSTPKYSGTTNGVDVWHYGVVVEDTSTSANTRYTFSSNVNDYINDAFNYDYTGSDPGSRSNFQLVSVECGIEITGGSSSDGGKAEGQYYKCDVRY